MLPRIVFAFASALLISACSAPEAAVLAATDDATATTSTESLTLHVGELTGSTSNLGSTWTAEVVATVVDRAGEPVVEATVSGRWDQGEAIEQTCVTDGLGQCALTSAPIKKNTKYATLAVSGVEHPDFTYTSSDDHDPDSITQGTSIRISKT
jgi:hypothetical protein